MNYKTMTLDLDGMKTMLLFLKDGSSFLERSTLVSIVYKGMRNRYTCFFAELEDLRRPSEVQIEVPAGADSAIVTLVTNTPGYNLSLLDFKVGK